MAKKLKEKETFGTITVDNFSPKKTDAWPDAINVNFYNVPWQAPVFRWHKIPQDIESQPQGA